MSVVDVSGVAKIVRVHNGQRINIPILILGTDAVWVESRDLDLGFPNAEKYVDKIVFDLNVPAGVQQLNLKVGYRDRLQDEVVWTPDIAITQDHPVVNLQKTAKFFIIKLREDLPIDQWKLTRVEFWGEVMGGRL